MEHFGYPDFVLATGDELIGKQYEDRPHLRAIYDRILRPLTGAAMSSFRHERRTCRSSRRAGRLHASRPPRRHVSISAFALKGNGPPGAYGRRKFTRACGSRSVSLRPIKSIRKCGTGCVARTLRTPRKRSIGARGSTPKNRDSDISEAVGAR
jgi:hypothetical protein